MEELKVGDVVYTSDGVYGIYAPIISVRIVKFAVADSGPVLVEAVVGGDMFIKPISGLFHKKVDAHRFQKAKIEKDLKAKEKDLKAKKKFLADVKKQIEKESVKDA